MSSVLKTRIVKIGNSHGVRIPKVWLDQLALENGVEMAMDTDQIIIRPANRPRHKWEAQFQAMAANHDDHIQDEALSTHWDKEEWEW